MGTLQSGDATCTETRDCRNICGICVRVHLQVS